MYRIPRPYTYPPGVACHTHDNTHDDNTHDDNPASDDIPSSFSRQHRRRVYGFLRDFYIPVFVPHIKAVFVVCAPLVIDKMAK